MKKLGRNIGKDIDDIKNDIDRMLNSEENYLEATKHLIRNPSASDIFNEPDEIEERSRVNNKFIIEIIRDKIKGTK